VDRNTVHVDEKAEMETTDVNKDTRTEELNLELDIKTIKSTPRSKKEVAEEVDVCSCVSRGNHNS